MTSFVRVRTPAEISKVINEIRKNSNKIKGIIEEETIDSQFAKQEVAKQQAPTVDALGEISKKINETFNPIVLDKNGNFKINDKGEMVRHNILQGSEEILQASAE